MYANFLYADGEIDKNLLELKLGSGVVGEGRR